MRNIESYRPEKKVARGKSSRNFSHVVKNDDDDDENRKNFDIKHNPKIIRRAISYTLTTVVLVGAIIFSTYQIIRWKAESDITNETIATIQKETIVTEIKNPEKAVEIKKPDNQRYLDMDLITVDFSNLKQQNNNTTGWINVPGTSINYPYVQTDNNDFYLRHTFDGHWSDAGWVFLDYRNSSKLNDDNQIIYAHGRVDGSMFGSLQNVLSKEWQDNLDNHVVKIATETNSSLWQVFSVYRIGATNDYLTTNFSDEKSFSDFLAMLKNRSAYDFKTDITVQDKIITLSTCIGTNERAVLHAKLIKTVEK